MSKKWFKCWYRHPRTTQERKENQEDWGRMKRRDGNLVEAWDDLPRQNQRTWKKHRKTQYKDKNPDLLT